MAIDKTHFLGELRTQFETRLATARKAAIEAGEAAEKLPIEFGGMSKATLAQAIRAREELEALEHFAKQPAPAFDRKKAIGLGAMVDVRTDEDERTFYLLPVGAGSELCGPGGDGFVSVITPASPVGKQLMGRRVGESIDVTIKGENFEWTVVDVG